VTKLLQAKSTRDHPIGAQKCDLRLATNVALAEHALTGNNDVKNAQTDAIFVFVSARRGVSVRWDCG